MNWFRIIAKDSLHQFYHDNRVECVSMKELIDDSRMLFDEKFSRKSRVLKIYLLNKGIEPLN